LTILTALSRQNTQRLDVVGITGAGKLNWCYGLVSRINVPR
jgi:hypothetical protein